MHCTPSPHVIEKTGLPGCGPATAFGLARCGMGNSLLAAESNHDFSGLHHQAWRNDMRRHLYYDPTTHIGRRHPMLAENVPDKIPNFDTWSAYLHPAIHESFVPVCEPGIPDAGKIAAVAVSLFGWENASHLLDTFRGKFWPSVVTSELLQDLGTWQPNNQDVSGGHSKVFKLTNETVWQGCPCRSCDTSLLPSFCLQTTGHWRNSWL